MTGYRRWFVGTVVGAIVGVGSLLGGPIGASLGVIAALLLARRAPRAWPVGGLCLGLGGSWVPLLVRADMAYGIERGGADLRPWYGVAGTFVLLGALVNRSALGVARGRA